MLNLNRLPIIVSAAFFLALALTIAPVAESSYGNAWISQALFTLAAIGCVVVLVFPGSYIFRPLSGAIVGIAFAWRAVAVFVTWAQGGQRSIYGVVLYVGIAHIFVICWADMLPRRPRVREVLAKLGDHGDP